MHPKGHHVTGAATGAIVAGIARLGHPDFNAVHLGALVLAGWFGGVAPDRLEFLLTRRHRWCPHRTFTHWGILWILLFGFALIQVFWPHALHLGFPAILSWLILGFSSGGLVHLLMDWPNPTGVPWWLPFRRHSLNLWNSGRMDILLSLVFIGAAYLVWRFF
ncbi:metal-dependent hydrolase [Acidithiobacillus sp. MC6.1]|nr:metal-dependent hydrolase [Acidithiobacillus sp. MC6.1]